MITASKIDLAHKCEGAFALEQLDDRNEYQGPGNERHKDWEDGIAAGTPPSVLAERWPGYTWRAEVAFSIDLSSGKGAEIGAGIARAYGDLGVFAVAGTADAVGRGPAGQLVIVDQKSFDPNVARAAVNGQLNTLALAATRAYGVESAEVAIVHQTRALDVAELDFIQLAQFETELRGVLERSAAARAKVRDGLALDLRPGSHCRWCAAFAACPAQATLALDIRSGDAEMRIAEMSLDDDETASRAYAFLQRVKMLTARLSSMIYARAATAPIPLGDGRWFGKHATMGKTKIDADIAYEVVRGLHGQGAADAAVSRSASQASIERALEIVGDKGKVAALKRAVMAEIKTRGGVKREPGETIEEFQHELKAASGGEP